MKPSKLYGALRALIGERVPLHIWGPCGTGKSQIVRQVASDLGYEFLDVRAVQLDPVDLRGLPRISSDQTAWVPPKFLPNSGKGILFLDELTSAPQMTQAGCYQLVLDRRLGEYRLPDEWVVIAAGNPASERGVHFAMPRPLRNRFVHLDLEPDLEDWSKWAIKAHVRPEIIAFLRFKPELLHAADVTSDANAWPTPRSWEMASCVLAGVAKRTGAKTPLWNERVRGATARRNSGTRQQRPNWSRSCGCFVNCRRLTKSFSIPLPPRFPSSLLRRSPSPPPWDGY